MRVSTLMNHADASNRFTASLLPLVNLFICLFICLLIYLFIYSFIYSFIYLRLHVFTTAEHLCGSVSKHRAGRLDLIDRALTSFFFLFLLQRRACNSVSKHRASRPHRSRMSHRSAGAA
jgi:hypothetical protein